MQPPVGVFELTTLDRRQALTHLHGDLPCLVAVDGEVNVIAHNVPNRGDHRSGTARHGFGHSAGRNIVFPVLNRNAGFFGGVTKILRNLK